MFISFIIWKFVEVKKLQLYNIFAICNLFKTIFLCQFSINVVQVALKTLTVIHRTLRDGDPTFREELLNFSQRMRIFQLANFKDDSSPIGIHFHLLVWFDVRSCY